MVKTKHIDESLFARLVKEATVQAELIASRQDEKQSVLDQFNGESKRFYFGKISERALASSVTKTNKELRRIDNELKLRIKNCQTLLDRTKTLIANQKPISFTASITGAKNLAKSKKKPTKKKVAKKTADKKPAKKKAKTKKVKKKSSKKKKR